MIDTHVDVNKTASGGGIGGGDGGDGGDGGGGGADGGGGGGGSTAWYPGKHLGEALEHLGEAPPRFITPYSAPVAEAVREGPLWGRASGNASGNAAVGGRAASARPPLLTPEP